MIQWDGAHVLVSEFKREVGDKISAIEHKSFLKQEKIHYSFYQHRVDSLLILSRIAITPMMKA
jgi:hypothetical protein